MLTDEEFEQYAALAYRGNKTAMAALPMGEWCEERRYLMTGPTVVENAKLHRMDMKAARTSADVLTDLKRALLTHTEPQALIAIPRSDVEFLSALLERSMMAPTPEED